MSKFAEEKEERKYPNATLDDVKKRINVLRTNFRRERQRLSECSRSGAGYDDSLEPSLFYYNEMQFLSDMDTPCSSKSTLQGKNLLREAVSKSAKRKPDATEALVEIASKRFAHKEKSTATAVTESWAVKLDRMVTEQRILCEKFVEDLMFEGQMGTLTRNSVKINKTTSYPTPVTLSRTSSPIEQYSSTSSTPARLEINSTTPVHFSNDIVDDNASTQSISAFFSSFTD